MFLVSAHKSDTFVLKRITLLQSNHYKHHCVYETLLHSPSMKKSEIKENLLYLCIWVLLFLSPIISMSVRMTDNPGMDFSWHEVIRVWRVFIPYLLVFLIHNFLIAPLLIYKKKKLLYAGLALCMIVVFQAYACSLRPKYDDRSPMHEAPHKPPHLEDFDANHLSIHPPKPNPDAQPPAPPHTTPEPHDGFIKEPPIVLGQQDLVALIVIVLMLGMNLGVKLYFKNTKDLKMLEQLEHKNLEQQLEYLKYQINPHFFMNTLNNIHALVDIEPEEAKSSIVELSKMMRYVLYDGAKSSVPLTKDIAFINNYITLMKLRYTEKVKISVDIEDDLPNLQVPPMIFITFVENAFKHGVSYKQDSFIKVALKHSDDHLLFTCQNSKAASVDNSPGGVGLSNTRRRLDLLYGDNYQLDIDDGDHTYNVALSIPAIEEKTPEKAS